MELNLVHPDFKDVRNFTEILEQTATSFLMRIEYPDGVIVLIKTVGAIRNVQSLQRAFPT